MRINKDAIEAYADSRMVDKIFEQFEYAFEDHIIDHTNIPEADSDEEDSARMDIVYEIMAIAMMRRYNYKRA